MPLNSTAPVDLNTLGSNPDGDEEGLTSMEVTISKAELDKKGNKKVVGERIRENMARRAL